MTTTSMTTQEMNNFLEYQKSYLRVQRDELKAIRDQEQAKLKQIEIGESIVSMLEGLIANGSGTIEGVEEEKIDEEVRETDTSQGISALDQIGDYSSDEDDIQQVLQKSAEPLPIKNDQGEVLLKNKTTEDANDVARMGIKHFCEETNDVENMKEELECVPNNREDAVQFLLEKFQEMGIEPKREDGSGNSWYRLYRGPGAVKLLLEEKNKAKTPRAGLLTTWHLENQWEHEICNRLGLKKYGNFKKRYQYDTVGKSIQEVKEFIDKYRELSNQLEI